MPINTQDLMNAVSLICDEHNMRCTISQSAKGAMVTAGTTFIGGILGGPIGLAVGAIIGGVGSAVKLNGTFKPVSEILRNDMTNDQRKQLQEHIINAVRNIHPTDLAMLIPLIMAGDRSIQTAVIRTVTSFITNEMGLRMID